MFKKLFRVIFSIFLILFSIFYNAQQNISSKWIGNYSVNFSSERNYAPKMFWEHKFSISRKTCDYEGSGFQFYVKYKCYAKESKDTLVIYAKTYQDGYSSYIENEIIMKLHKVKTSYYTNTISLKPEEAQSKMSKFGYRVFKK